MPEELLYHIGEYKKIRVTLTGPASYTTGGAQVTVSSAKKIIAIERASNDGGYIVEEKDLQDSISDNAFNLVVRQVNTTTGLTQEVAAATDLSTVNFEIIVVAV